MASKARHRILGGVFFLFAILMALAALSELAMSTERGLSAGFVLPAILAGLFLAAGLWIFSVTKPRRRGRE